MSSGKQRRRRRSDETDRFSSFQFAYLLLLYKIILVAVLVVMSIIEVCRLYLGYYGNLSEKVPELAGFWIMTLMLQLPLNLFSLVNDQSKILPLERAVHIVLLGFLIVEIIGGYIAVRRMVKYQLVRYHVDELKKTNLQDLMVDLKKSI